MRFFIDLFRPGVAVGNRLCDRCGHTTTRVSGVQAEIYLASIRNGTPFLPCWCGGRLRFAERPRRLARQVLADAVRTFAGRDHETSGGAPGVEPGAPPEPTPLPERGRRL